MIFDKYLQLFEETHGKRVLVPYRDREVVVLQHGLLHHYTSSKDGKKLVRKVATLGPGPVCRLRDRLRTYRRHKWTGPEAVKEFEGMTGLALLQSINLSSL